MGEVLLREDKGLDCGGNVTKKVNEMDLSKMKKAAESPKVDAPLQENSDANNLP